MGICISPPAPPTSPPPPPKEPTREEFSPGHVNIAIDKRKDEEKIDANIKGYPKPEPPDHHKVQNLQRRNFWFNDDDFNNASDDADLFKIETAVDDESIDLEKMSDELLEKQTGAVLEAKPVVSYDEIDTHAKKADKSLLGSFEDLISYLTEPLHKDQYRKMKIARAIVVWMSQQNLEKEQFGKASVDSPRGLMQYLKEERMTYTTCYTILCRKAGLQCAVIEGHTKSASYEPGDKIVSKQSWCAVYVECGWQIIVPFWICQALYGHNLGGWVKVEKDGKTMRKKETASEGVVFNTFRDIYFMPNPEEFIYKCCALEKEWQLVKPECNVSSVNEFLDMPFLFLTFFGVGLQLTSEPKCVLKSKDGFCKIEMKTSTAKSPFLVLRYELFMKESDSEIVSGDTIEHEMSRMVFNSRAGETFTFEIRFPRTGVYKLVIYGGPYKSGALRLCEFKLICEQEMKNRSLLPLDIECQDIGWGPGPVSVEAGLLMPSRPNGLIPVSEKEKEIDIKFQLGSMENQYKAEVHGEVDGRRKKYEDAVVTQKNKTLRQLVFKISIPGNGEFGVSITHVTSTTTVKSKKEISKAVCNYLVSTCAFVPERANVKNAKQKLKDSVAVASQVEPRDWKKHIDYIEDNINRCSKEKVPDSDDEVLAARDTVGLLKCKDKLRDCELRRNLHVIYKTLHAVSRYRNKAVVTKEKERVEALKQELIALRGFARQVPKLEDAYKEIVALAHAPEEVLNTFKALVVLLGENDSNIQEWAGVLNRLRRSTHATEDSVLGKMKGIQKQNISSEKRKKVLEILKKYDEDQVRKVNSDAHCFYVWIEKVVNVRGEK